jgi:hypothetical protein
MYRDTSSNVKAFGPEPTAYEKVRYEARKPSGAGLVAYWKD